ncbi:MAG: hypothetical protein K6G10_04830 [Butyrivibrio sp.]|nr:hypothetical protein [Butyrivibrio sp.]
MKKIGSFFKRYKKEIWTVTWSLLLAGAITAVLSLLFGVTMFANISSYLQYVTVILALLAWNNTRKLLENREKQHLYATSKDMILTVSLSNDVHADVAAYLSSLTGDDIPLRELEPISFSSGSYSDEVINSGSAYMELKIDKDISGALSITRKADMPNDGTIVDYMSEFQECIKKVFAIMSENGIQRLHVFIAAPVGVAAYITPYFSNKKTVIFYRYVRDLPQKYIQMGPVENRGEE